MMYGLLVLFVGGSTFFCHQLLKRHDVLHQMVDQMKIEQGEMANKQIASEPQMIEKIIAKSEAWRPVQEKIKDTVVQIFSHVAEIDLLQPYKTPSQYTASGSGFFINEDGYLITNAHVINQAKAVWIQIPSLGRRILDVNVIGISPDRDLALLKLSEESFAVVKQELGAIPHLPLGDSDSVHRADEVMALGYPLGQQSLKSTTGVISGRESHFIQMSAAINPGSSGGPLLNVSGEVVGINCAGMVEAQNVGYLIPVNDLKIILPDMYKIALLRKPFLGVLYNNATDELTEFLGNPQPGGCYVVDIIKKSTLERAGVKQGDMIYSINGHKIDVYGEMSVPWSEDKISIMDYVSRLSIGDKINLVVYRNGKEHTFTTEFSHVSLPAVREIYPGYEDVDYEIVAGMVIMELTLNHVRILLKKGIPGLSKYTEMKNQAEPALIVTHIFPTSQIYRARTLQIGATVNEVNGVDVHTLHELRDTLRKNVTSKFLTLRISDNITRASDNILIALPFDKVLNDEAQLAHDYKYPLSETVKELLVARAEKTDSMIG